jgi:predicted dehydrogenase
MSLKIGVVGGGSVARPHMEAYVKSSHAGAVILADVSEDRLKAMSDEWGIIKGTVTDYHALLTDDSIDVIDCCTPHHLHHPVAMDALRAGKHVIVEKPIAMTVEQGQEMIAEAKRQKRRLFVAMNQRMFPAHLKAKELLTEGALGKPFLGIANIIGNEFDNMNRADHWKGSWEKAGGGALMDTGYHAVYMMQHFLGEAQAVTARTRRLLVQPQNKADDNSGVLLDCPNNVMVNIVVTYTALAHPWTEQRHIFGTEGSIHIYDGEDNPLVFVRGQEATPIKVRRPLNLWWYSIAQTLDHFLDCIVSDKEPDIKPKEAVSALRTILAAYESDRTGQRVTV